MEQAANQASGGGNPLVPGVATQTNARKKRFGGSSLTTWLTLAILVILSATFFLYLLVPIAGNDPIRWIASFFVLRIEREIRA